jgi:hypothetical protein
MDQKLEYLEDANQILSESINVDSDGNWFASLPLNRFFIFTKIKQTGRDPIGPMIVDGIP